MFTLKHLKTLQHVSISFRSSSGSSGTHLHTERTYTHQMLCCRIATLTITLLTNFKISNFNKEHTSSLKISMRSKHVGAFLSVIIWTL